MQQSVSSAQAPETIVEAIQKLQRKKRNGNPVIVAVAGGSGDGKGHLIARLVERLGDENVSVLCLDDYYVGRRQMQERGIPHFDCPEALDLGLAAEHVRQAQAGATLRIPRYDFASGERVGEQDLAVRKVLVVDGLFALHPSFDAAADLKVFVRSDHDSSMLRRVFRDAGPNGRTGQSPRDVLRQYFEEVWPAKEKHIDPTAASAHLIVESQYDPSVEAHRAGPAQYQLKVRGTLRDDVLAACGVSRLGAPVRQVDRFLRPKARKHHGELLRLRLEGEEALLTYKGPFLGSGARHVAGPISLPREAIAWFSPDYETCGTFEKRRTLYLAAGGLVVARDAFEKIGSWFEIRGASEADLPRMRDLARRLAPGSEIETRGYLDIWRELVPSFRH